MQFFWKICQKRMLGSEGWDSHPTPTSTPQPTQGHPGSASVECLNRSFLRVRASASNRARDGTRASTNNNRARTSTSTSAQEQGINCKVPHHIRVHNVQFFDQLVVFECRYHLSLSTQFKLHSFLSKKTIHISPPPPKVLGQKRNH